MGTVYRVGANFGYTVSSGRVGTGASEIYLRNKWGRIPFPLGKEGRNADRRVAIWNVPLSTPLSEVECDAR